MTLPGVDYPTALALVAAWGTVEQFNSPAQAASYLGLSPSTRQSDQHCYHGPITKRGNPHTGWMLIQAAQQADRHPGSLGVFFRPRAHKKGKGRNVAVVATTRKLATIGWHMLQNNQPYWYALPRPTQTKLVPTPGPGHRSEAQIRLSQKTQSHQQQSRWRAHPQPQSPAPALSSRGPTVDAGAQACRTAGNGRYGSG